MPKSSGLHILGTSARSQSSFLSSSPIAYASIARDLEDEDDNDEGIAEDAMDVNELGEGNPNASSEYSLASSYRRTSYVASGPRPLFPGAQPPDRRRALNEQDREAALAEERSLLRDNHLIPPKHPRRESTASGKLQSGLLKFPGFVPRKGSQVDNDSAVADSGEEPSETTALIRNPEEPYGGVDTPENINKRWEEAVASGKIKTTWQREAVVLGRYSRSLILTFLLQYSLTVASIFTVGHIGKVELGAVSLASMTANITGYAIYQGLATSLDTLCAQAYGSGMCEPSPRQMHAYVRVRQENLGRSATPEDGILSVGHNRPNRLCILLRHRNLAQNRARGGYCDIGGLISTCVDPWPAWLCSIRGWKEIRASTGNVQCDINHTAHLRASKCDPALRLCLGKIQQSMPESASANAM